MSRIAKKSKRRRVIKSYDCDYDRCEICRGCQECFEEDKCSKDCGCYGKGRG